MEQIHPFILEKNLSISSRVVEIMNIVLEL